MSHTMTTVLGTKTLLSKELKEPDQPDYFWQNQNLRPLSNTGASEADEESDNQKNPEGVASSQHKHDPEEDDVGLPLQPLPLAGVQVQTLSELQEDADVEEHEAGKRDDDQDQVPGDVVVDQDEEEVVVQLRKNETALGGKFQLEKFWDVEGNCEHDDRKGPSEGLLSALVDYGRIDDQGSVPLETQADGHVNGGGHGHVVERVPEHVEEVGKIDLAVEAGLNLLNKAEDDEEGVADSQEGQQQVEVGRHLLPSQDEDGRQVGHKSGRSDNLSDDVIDPKTEYLVG